MEPTTTPADLRAAAEAWLADDPDPDTRDELQGILDADDRAALADRFAVQLSFGTAGIRGALGAGPGRMNRSLIRRVTAGVARRLLADGGAPRGVVVGLDARRNSVAFADDTARVLAGAGIRVHRFEGHVPTPLVAFAVRHLDAAAGIQITASHNPATDNGYKVYWAGGAQITEPLDTEIAQAVAAIASLSDIPMADPSDPLIGVLDARVRRDYVDACLGLQLHPDTRDLRVVYTPLHGVAGDLLTEVLAAGGFTDVTVTPEQADPDPGFPTVPFPNPEEPGALDLALALAAETDAHLVLANDPDGDRIAAAIPDPSAEGGWRGLNGDEIGCLLAEYVLAEGPGDGERVVGTTVVSSQQLARIAAHHGVGYVETLTGFKWLARATAEAEAQGRRMVVAYEQALGAMVGTAVRDKDGISAALVLAELAAVERSRGRSLQDALDDLARRHGVHATTGRSIRLEGADGLALVARILTGLRDRPPESVGGVDVVAWEDRAAQVRRHVDGRPDDVLETPSTDLLGYLLADGSRLQVRPSGTEPLLKFYVEVVEPVRPAEDLGDVRARAQQRLGLLADAFVELAP